MTQHYCRSRVLLVLLVCVALAHVSSSQQSSTPTAPASTDAKPSTGDTAAKKADAKDSDADDEEDDDDEKDVKDNKAKKGKKAKKEKPELVSTAVAADPANVKLLNPPDDEEMKTKGESWKGEYHVDKEGKPLLGLDGKMLPVLYDKKGKRMKSKVKKKKTHPISIVSGTLTVDGWTGKAHLNYEIPDLKFIYISAPTIGTVLVSQAAFPGSTEQKGAFQDKTLTVKVDDHELQLASNGILLDKKKESAWVRVDAEFLENPRVPTMGFGNETAAPYIWPGAKVEKYTGGISKAPPLPVDMRPKLAEQVCKDADKAKCKPVAKPVVIQQATAPKAAPARVPAAPVPHAASADDTVLTETPVAPAAQAPVTKPASTTLTQTPPAASSAPVDDTVLIETPVPTKTLAPSAKPAARRPRPAK